jgi:hypothetical protein
MLAFSLQLILFLACCHQQTVGLKKTHRRCFSCTLTITMDSFSTSSRPVPVLRCSVLFNGTNYYDWVPRMRLHMRGFQLWDFLTSELPCPPSQRRLLLLRRRNLLQIMMIVWLHMSLSFVHTGLGLMRMLGLPQFLQSTYLAAIHQEQLLRQGDTTVEDFFDQISII